MTRYGLRPRHVADTLAVIACSAAGFRVENLLAQCNKTYFGAENLNTIIYQILCPPLVDGRLTDGPYRVR